MNTYPTENSCYWYLSKYDMTDTLAIIHYENEIYDRIRNALGKYGLSEFKECIVSGNSWINPKLEKVMKKDFKENFNINLSVNHCTIADIYRLSNVRKD